jgi:diguanylate cyclase (GGDEF)-like protein
VPILLFLVTVNGHVAAMVELIPGLLTGGVAGAIIGWVVGHHWASQAKNQEQKAGEEATRITEVDEQERVESITRKIRSLTLSVAADVSAHQNQVADITTDLETSAAESQTDAILSTVSRLVATNKAMQEKLAASQDQIREQSRQLQTSQRLANTDALTGLANRRVFDTELEKRKDIAGAARGTLAMIDIDHFKSVNDIYGHVTGDAVLSRVAELIDSHLGDIALCARFGGEEFAVVSEKADWNTLAERLDIARAQLSCLRLIPEDPSRQITFSCGLTPHFQNEANEQWLARADAALYAAKHDGRNNIQVNKDSVTERYTEREVAKEAVNRKAAVARPAASSQAGGMDSSEDAAKANRRSLVSLLRTMATNIDLNQVNLAAVAIRLPNQTFTSEQRETLLAQARGLSRPVDKIGFDDAQTIIVLMVTSNMRKTEERANQLLDQINFTLRTMLTKSDDTATANLGVSILDDNVSPDEVIRVANERARSGSIATA